MTVEATVNLPDDVAQRLKMFSKRTGLSENDLIVAGIESVLAGELDKTHKTLTSEQFEAVRKFLQDPTPQEVVDRLKKTLAHSYPWKHP